jgi:acyl carrier protein
MPTAEIYSTLTEIFHVVFARNDIVLRPELTGRDLPGWDSFKFVEIIAAVEQRYAMTFGSEELDSLETVGDFVRAVATRTGQASGAMNGGK